MPNNGRKIYTENGKGIDIRNDVYKILGISPRSNGFDVGYACGNAHGQIKMWAKYKPEAIGGPNPLTLIQRQENNFGLRAKQIYGSHVAFESAIKSNTQIAGFDYIAPGTGNFKRIGDFNGYDHKAESPFGSLTKETHILTGANDDETTIFANDPAPGEDGIQIGDFKNVDYPLADWYFGICLHNKKRTIMATRETTMGSSEMWEVNMGHLTLSDAGIYTGYPFLCSGIIKPNVGALGESKVILLDATGAEVNLLRPSDMYAIDAICWYPDKSKNVIKYRIRITNEYGTPRTIKNLVLQVATSDSGSNAETLVTFSNSSQGLVIAAQDTWETSGQVTLNGHGNTPADTYRYFSLMSSDFTDLPWWDMDEDVDEDDVR